MILAGLYLGNLARLSLFKPFGYSFDGFLLAHKFSLLAS